MGVSVSEWRFSIGTFKSIYVHMKCGKKTQHPYLAGWVFNIFVSFTEVVPLKICFGLLKVFIINFMVVLLLPIFLISYTHLEFHTHTSNFIPAPRISYPHLKFHTHTSNFSFEHYPACIFSRYFVHAFSKIITFLPIFQPSSHTCLLYSRISFVKKHKTFSSLLLFF